MKNALIIALLLVVAASTVVYAAGERETRPTINLVGVTVHEENVTGGPAGDGVDLLSRFNETHNTRTAFILGTTSEVQQRLFRVGTLARTDEDIVYVLHSMADARITDLLEPLDDYLRDAPMDGFPDDYAPGMLETFTVQGSLYAIPVRAGTWSLWYNKRILEERGITELPTTPQELLEMVRQTTYTRPNGERVYGFVSRGLRWDLHEQLAIGARMYGGDLITPQHEIVIDQSPVIQALELYRRMYQEELMPPNWNSINAGEGHQLFMSGRAAFTLTASAMGSLFNQPETSREAGNLFPLHVPLAPEFWNDERTFSDSISFTWAMAIFRGSGQKDLAWELIRYLGERDNRVEMAKNANAPARISVLDWLSREDDGARVAADTFPYTRSALPPLMNGNEIIDIIGEHMENVVIGGRPPQVEMDRAAERIRPLMD